MPLSGRTKENEKTKERATAKTKAKARATEKTSEGKDLRSFTKRGGLQGQSDGALHVERRGTLQIVAGHFPKAILHRGLHPRGLLRLHHTLMSMG